MLGMKLELPLCVLFHVAYPTPLSTRPSSKCWHSLVTYATPTSHTRTCTRKNSFSLQYPDPVEDPTHQLPLTMTELGLITSATQKSSPGGFFCA